MRYILPHGRNNLSHDNLTNTYIQAGSQRIISEAVFGILNSRHITLTPFSRFSSRAIRMLLVISVYYILFESKNTVSLDMRFPILRRIMSANPGSH